MADESEPRESTILDSSLDKDPRVAIAAFWRGTVLFFDRLHSRILAKYPRLLIAVDWLLEFLYALFASPITALVVSLLLVPFVISGSIPIIIFCSVTMAWFLCVIAVARAKPVKQLSIIPRFAMVGIIALLMFGASKWYIRWSLVNYIAHAQLQIPAMSGIANSRPDMDQLGNRLDALIREELRKSIQSIVPSTPTQHPVSPTVPSTAAAADKSSNPYAHLSDAELVGVSKVVAKQIDDVMGAWKWQIQSEIEPRRRDQVRERDPAPEEDERNRLDAYYDKQIEEANQTYGSQAKVLFIRAEALREVLVNRLAQNNSMPIPTDGTMDDLFKGAAATGIDSFNNSYSSKVSAHLLALCKRLEQVLG